MVAAKRRLGKIKMRIKNLRWWIVGLLFFGTALNYLDRNVLAILEPMIKRDLNWTPQDWGLINGGFWLAYAVFAMVTGRLLDKIGTKLGYTLMLAWWGTACALHGFAGSVMGFVILRFALGMAESGVIPATAKACAEWFPQKERGFAYGLSVMGMMIGGIVAPPVTGLIAMKFGWQWAFFVTGGVCALWLLGWQWLFNDPAKNKHITEAERGYILKNKMTEHESCPDNGAGGRVSIRNLVGLPQVWGIAVARFLGDPVWAFFVAWIPKYMSEARGIVFRERKRPKLSIEQIFGRKCFIEC